MYGKTADEDPLLELVGSIDDPSLPADLSTRHDEYAVTAHDRDLDGVSGHAARPAK
jgi:hypothetical protein